MQIQRKELEATMVVTLDNGKRIVGILDRFAPPYMSATIKHPMVVREIWNSQVILEPYNELSNEYYLTIAMKKVESVMTPTIDTLCDYTNALIDYKVEIIGKNEQ